MTLPEPQGGTTPVEDDVIGLQAALDAEAERAGGDVGDIAADYVEELLDICDLDGDIDIEDEGGRTTVKVAGGDLRLLSSPDVVGALQELTRLAVQQSTGTRNRLMLDIAGWRSHRRSELTDLGRRAAEEVRDSGESQKMRPMTPFERKIVHDAVAGVEGVHSESEGEEPRRRVVVLPGRS
jgi:spoIIIJ-associated protein